jgi:cytosolic carboxypeptidase protein 6
MTPLVKSTGRPKWQRIAKSNVYYYKSVMHKNHYVLSFSFAFDREDEVFQFCLSFPYSYSRLQSYLNVLDQKFPNQFERSVVGNSMVGHIAEANSDFSF